MNMFDNYQEDNGEKLASVDCTKDVVTYIIDMLNYFDIKIFYDPNRTSETRKEGEDDLFWYCKDMVTRFLLSLAFDTCESEGDAVGLRALRRIMVCYFLATKPERLDSKYASFTLIDLVVELSESERTRQRMDNYVTINPSGAPGGGLFSDKYQEHCIRAVKSCLRSTHGGLGEHFSFYN